MSRVSFGSRAGDATDYGGGGHTAFAGARHARITGPYSSLEALINALADEFRAAAESPTPVCTTIELCLGLDAMIPLVRPGIGPYAEGGEHDLPAEFKDGTHEAEPDAEQKHPRAPCGTIIKVADPKTKQIVQRAASRGVIAAIEALDGFRYSFNNAWTAKDEEGARFSFICQDSMQNKDRHANGYTRILKHLKDPAGAERGPRKPTYDCKGSISVKFSASRGSCDVYYRHNPIHDTVAARKPQARGAPGVKRTSSSWIRLPNAPADIMPPREVNMGGLSAMLTAENANTISAVVEFPTGAYSGPTSSNIGRPLKRKREEVDRPALMPQPSGQPLSLADLLLQSETAPAPAPAPAPPIDSTNSKISPAATAVAYELPSWQAPPPPLYRPVDGLPYNLPYQPHSQKAPITPLIPRGPATPAATRYPSQPQKIQQFRTGNMQKPAQGLFTTMKVVGKPRLRWPEQDPQMPPSVRQFVAPLKPRSVLACTNCRVAKRRCDEGRPVCGACYKTARSHCRYEPPVHCNKQSASDSSQQPQQSDESAPPHTSSSSTSPPAQPAQDAGQSTALSQTQSSWSQSGRPSELQSQHLQPSEQSGQNWSTSTPVQEPPQSTWDTGGAVQAPSLSNWSQDSAPPSQWPNTTTQSTDVPQWPSQTPPPLQAWGNLSMASSSAARPSSPDPWYPKRD